MTIQTAISQIQQHTQSQPNASYKLWKEGVEGWKWMVSSVLVKYN